MNRVFMISVVLIVILSLPSAFLMAQESEEKSAEAERQEIKEGRAERDQDQPTRSRGEYEDVIKAFRRVEQEERLRERAERLYEKLFIELERQREEIRALREEIGALRRMLEDQYASGFFQRGRGWLVQPITWGQWWGPERMPPQERWEQERHNIEMEIGELEREVESRPRDIELRMRLAQLYREIDNIGAATEQYKAALEIDPDFDPPYHALKELGYRFPDALKEREEPPLEDSVGEVISTKEAEVELETLEGDIVIFRVPSRQKEDGSWVLNDDIPEFVKSLEPGTRVKILWREIEGNRVIHRIKVVKE